MIFCKAVFDPSFKSGGQSGLEKNALITADYNLICTLEKPPVAKSSSQVQILVDNFVMRAYK